MHKPLVTKEIDSSAAHVLLNTLLDMAKCEGIPISYRPSNLSNFYIKLRNPMRAFIFLDESLRFDLPFHLEVLSHELGHHFTDPTSNPFSASEVEILEDEIKAWKWAAEFLCKELADIPSWFTDIEDVEVNSDVQECV